MTLYEVLGVTRDASPEQIKAAFHKKSLENHPDVAGNNSEQTERQREINAAYQILKDPKPRAIYDRKMATPHLSAEDAERLHRQLYELAAATLSFDRIKIVEVLDGFVIDPKVREFGSMLWDAVKRKILTRQQSG